MQSTDSRDGQDTETVKWSSLGMNPIGWTFMNEPAWKWAVFVVAMSLFLTAWAGVIRFMK